MALTKNPQTLISNVTIASGSSNTSSGSVDLSGAIDFAIGYTMTFNSSATGGARIELYADPTSANPSFTVGTYDDPFDTADIERDNGHTVSGMVIMNRSAKYVKAKVVNSSGQSLTGVSIYATVQTQG